MFSRVIILLFSVITAFFGYLTYSVDRNYSIWIVIFLVLTTVSYIFSNQIQWWRNSNKPREIDDKMRQILSHNYDFYANLSLENKKIFRERMHAYMIGNNFMAKGGMKDVLTDIKGIIAAAATRLTFGNKEQLISKYENIIVYPKGFPSPQFPNSFHSSEIFEEDGVIMFSIEHLMKNFQKPDSYFDIALYEYAKIFMEQNSHISFPEYSDEFWETNEKITRFTKVYIQKHINLDLADIDLGAVMIVAFFTHSDKFKLELPSIYERYMNYFNLDLVEKSDPIIRNI